MVGSECRGLVEKGVVVERAADELARDPRQLLVVFDQAQAHLLLRDLGVASHRLLLAIEFLVAQVPERGDDGGQEEQHREQRAERRVTVLVRCRLAPPPAAEHALGPGPGRARGSQHRVGTLHPGIIDRPRPDGVRHFRRTNKHLGDKDVSSPRKLVRRCRQRPRCAGNARVARCPVGGHRLRRRRARPLPARAADRPGAPGRRRRTVLGQHRVRQHHPDRPGRAHAGQHRDRGAAARLHALERDGDGRQGQSPASARRRRPRRAHLELRLAGDDVRHRLQSLLARRDAPSTAATCSTSRGTRRPASTPAPSWKGG